MGANKFFEAVVPKTTRTSFVGAWLIFNWSKLNGKRYQTNGTLIEENYEGKLLFTLRYFSPFRADHQ